MEENFSLRAYLYSLRFYVLFVVALFIGSAVLGYNGILNDVFNAQLEDLQQLSETLKGFSEVLPTWLLFSAFFVIIFLKNAFTCFLAILLGPLLGIFPMFSAFINGGLIGWFARKEGLIILFAIVPHGIFELPAFFISVAIGLKLGREVLKKKGDRNLKRELGNGLRAFFTLILLLLVIAAIIESALIVLLPLLLDSF